MNRFFALLPLVVLFSCVSSGEIDSTPDPDMEALDGLLTFPELNQKAYELRKQVTLDGQSESSVAPLDTMVILQDLKPLREYSFVHRVRKASHDIVRDRNKITYQRKEKEKRGPVVLWIEKNKGGDIIAVSVQFEYHNYLYQSTQEIFIEFQNNRPIRYMIAGGRTLLAGLGQSSYQIDAEIVGI